MIIIMGPVGVGKSVQGQLLADKISYNWFSLGQYLRENAPESTQATLSAGKLLTDTEVIEIIDSELGRTIKDTSILDGFPRTLDQSKWLIQQHKNNRINIEAVVLLEADDSVLLERLMARGRQDDSEDIIKQRIETYNNLTLPIIEWFSEQNVVVHKINGVGSPEDISQNIVKALGKDAN